jgi:hypothetical protein
VALGVRGPVLPRDTGGHRLLVLPPQLQQLLFVLLLVVCVCVCAGWGVRWVLCVACKFEVKIMWGDRETRCADDGVGGRGGGAMCVHPPFSISTSPHTCVDRSFAAGSLCLWGNVNSNRTADRGRQEAYSHSYVMHPVKIFGDGVSSFAAPVAARTESRGGKRALKD